MQYLAMMTIAFDNGARIELYYAAHLDSKVTTDPYQATVRPLEQMIQMVRDEFGSQFSSTGPVWVFERVLVQNSGVLS